MQKIPEDLKKCFLCKIDFKKGDPVAEFFGGYAHWSCFDKQMKKNAKKSTI